MNEQAVLRLVKPRKPLGLDRIRRRLAYLRTAGVALCKGTRSAKQQKDQRDDWQPEESTLCKSHGQPRELR
jgi:hypothetical protein